MTNEYLEMGQRLAAARRELGWSQREMAKHLGISCRTLENWEQGRRTRWMQLILRIADLNISSDWLLCG
jgi:transcriptional regulator with XRE-family HTH domain